MSIRPVTLAPGEFFHVYNRGTDKRTIFLDHADHVRFLELLYLCNSNRQINVRDVKKINDPVFDYERGEQLVSIGAFCLMPNHFHLLITPNANDGISKFMNKVSTGYSMYFNKRYSRTGSLFQGKFKAEYTATDEYLKYLYSYIHLNPIKLIDPRWKEEGIKNVNKSFDFAVSFQYSSLGNYFGAKRETSAILNRNAFPEYFQQSSEIRDEIFEWFAYNTQSNNSANNMKSVSN